MRLNVLTLNLLHDGAVNPAGDWRARLPLVLQVLNLGADLVGLQEATPGQLADLEAALPDYTVVTGPESGETRMPRVLHRARRLWRRDPKPNPDHPHAYLHAHPHEHARRGEYCAILYRTDRFEALESNAFWLSHRPHVPGTVLPGTWLPRVVNWVRLRDRDSGAPIAFFNAHIDFMPWAPFRSARILRHMLDTHWDNTPQILVGDFNTLGNSRAYHHLCREMRHGFHPPLLDAWLAAENRDGPEGTYHGGTGRVRWTGRLDRILYRPHLRVERVVTLTHGIDGNFPSDHYPVLAAFRGDEA